MQKSEVTVSDLVSIIGGDLYGKPSLAIEKFASLKKAGPNQASFATHRINVNDILNCSASLLVIGQDQLESKKIVNVRLSYGLATIICAEPYLFFVRASSHINKSFNTPKTEINIHPTATVDKSVVLKKGVRIGAGCVIEPEVSIGEFSIISSLSFIGTKSIVGSNCLFHPRSTVLSDVIIGKNVILHSGCIIGSDGFGYLINNESSWEKIPQSGSVNIGDNVEIGANTTIDKGTFDSTTINSGCKVDNQVHIAHNVTIGKDTAIAGCVGIAGSAEIGDQCQIGGATGILGHLKICDKTVIGPMSLVLSDITKSGKYVGVYPLQTDREWKRSSSIVRNLDSLRKKLFRAKN
jgi:UDP-3-O-[3-hydroxymyristoyl] glucosamine N-acyltransferase